MKKIFSTTRFALISIIILGLTCGVNSFASHSLSDSTQVLVIGTIHGNHETNSHYTYQDLLNILNTYKPDVICVEIPPSYFRKQSYLKEMTLASMYGIEHAKKVYPIDWWTPEDDRAAYRQYIKTDEYKEKEKQYYELEKSNAIMQTFYTKYGSLEKVWNENQKEFEFFNGDEYNDYIREMYAINLSVFGDGPMNLHYKTRNDHMLALIDTAIAENKGKRIIVFTGAEHKHYFDIAFAKRNDLRLVQLKEILPLREMKPDKNLTDFITKDMARGYYDAKGALGVDMMYEGALISLLHGLGMDDDPTIVPEKNIQKAEPILAQWKTDNPKSACLHFEIAWVEFLKGNYKDAVINLKVIADKLDDTPEKFIKSFYYRNLGFCYDMLGKHTEAKESYHSGMELCKKLGEKEAYIKSIYKNYIDVPYNGQKRK